MSAHISHPVNINQWYHVSIHALSSSSSVTKGITETCNLATLRYPDKICIVGAVGLGFVYTDLRLEVLEMGYDPLADTQ
ncbi:hypothetical protein Tco_1197567 [Tanacetum coccineum]